MLDFTVDSLVTRISITAIESDEDDLEEDDEVSYSRLITIETADGAFRIEVVADDRANLEIVEG